MKWSVALNIETTLSVTLKTKLNVILKRCCDTDLLKVWSAALQKQKKISYANTEIT